MRETASVLGLDVGAVAIGLVRVDHQGQVLARDYVLHRGDLAGQLARLLAAAGPADYLALTGNPPAHVQGSASYDSQVAMLATCRRRHPQARELLIVGGERFCLARLGPSGEYRGSRANSPCAAGTGSFLDQQAGRLGLADSAALGALAMQAGDDLPRIASRCAVFAKTDLIHAQQEGYGLPAICNGLCHGLAANLVDALFAGQELSGQPIVMAGGVALNQAVRTHIAALTATTILADEDAHLYGAHGAALLLLADLARGLDLPRFDAARCLAPTTAPRDYAYPPLALVSSTYPDFAGQRRWLFSPQLVSGAVPVEVDIYHAPAPGIPTRAWLGIDIGSTSTKALLLATRPLGAAGLAPACTEDAPAPGGGDERVLAGFYTRTAGQPLRAVQAIFEAIEAWRRDEELQLEIAGAGTTGSGRKFIGAIIGAELVLDEISAHARAAYQLDPAVDTIIEIGGQDAKFTTLRDGVVTLSIMNHVCAAGTGSFIEEQAGRLGCPLAELSGRTAGQRAPLASDRCTVFMERDINHYLAAGYAVDEILAAVLHAVRENYLLKVARASAIGQRLCFQGATAKNRSLVAAFEQRLGPIQVSRYCHLTGALGVTLSLAEAAPAVHSFRGLELHREHIPIRAEVCDLCTNHCKLRLADVRGQTVAYGFLCGRDYEQERFVSIDRSGFDLLAERRKLFAVTPGSPRGPATIGVPAGLHLYEELPLWRRFFDLLGLRVISNERDREALRRGKHLAGAEFCAPMAAFHGQVANLAERADWVFAPIYLEDARRPPDTRRQLCYYTQYAPCLLPTMDVPGLAERLLSPVLEAGGGTWQTAARLYPALRPVLPDGTGFLQVLSAFTQARQEHDQRGAALRALATRELTAHAVPVRAVLLGRPYTALAPTMNKSIPEIFGALGVPCLFQDMLTLEPAALAPVQPLLDAVHWRYAAQLLAAAQVVARTPGLYPVLLTAFKCAPDSCVLEPLRRIFDAADKPYLILQLDEHDSQVGYETRIEAAVRSFANHQRRESAPAAPRPNLPIVTAPADHLSGRTVLLPAWDSLACRLMAANLRHEGLDAHVLHEDPGLIARSLRHNSGQCIPLNAIVEEAVAYIRARQLDPARCVLWTMDSTLSCNIGLYPQVMQGLLESLGCGEARVYRGEMSGVDIGLRAAVNQYFVFLLSGWLRRMAVRVRPYETEPGATDRATAESLAELEAAFEAGLDKDAVVERMVERFLAIPTAGPRRPLVAIFGDLYSRDNEIFNQDLVATIERHGGEVLTTPYTEYTKLIAGAYFKKWFREGKYLQVAINQPILVGMSLLERQYLRQFERVLGPEPQVERRPVAEVLARYHVTDHHSGESMDNLLKIDHLVRQHPDLALLVQANPAFCCPSLVTEAMSRLIEQQTGVPIVTITYDGTAANRNHVVIPYLRFAAERRQPQAEPATTTPSSR